MKYKTVKLELIRQGKTLLDMASYLGVDLAQMSMWINGHRKVPEHMREKVSAYLGLPEEVLFTDDQGEYFKLMSNLLK